MSKKELRINSSTTPGHKMLLRSWLAELAMTRSNRGSPLPAYFWRDGRWKWKYGQEVKAASKFIKKYGQAIVVSVVIDNCINTFSDYGNMEFFLQREFDSICRMAAPKDNTVAEKEQKKEIVDIREPKIFPKKKGVFEKLSEFEV